MHENELNLKLNIAIVGARGYSGLELTRLLKKHPAVGSIHLFASSAGEGVLPLDLIHQVSEKLDIVFLATPAELSAEIAGEFIQKSFHVIDISGAHRLDEAQYPTWYKFSHPDSTTLSKATYGLMPWAKYQVTKTSTLVANPGCYATAILMGLLPLLASDLIDEKSIVIDAKSGTTGAGKKADENQLFSEVDGECLPYKVGEHQHLPEIIKYAEIFSGKKINPFFTTSLLSVRRGITAGIYANLKDGKNEGDIEAAFKEFYLSYPLVKFQKGMPKDLLSLKKVVGTGEVHLSYKTVGEKLYLFSAIDNLLKGAASQAIENLNHLYQLPVDLGLSHLEAIV